MKRTQLIILVLLALGLALLAGCSKPTPQQEANATPAPATAETQATAASQTPAPATPEAPGTPEPEKEIKSWPMAPHMFIDQEKIYLATIKTEHGDIVVELDAKNAPITTNSFIFLANEGFYDDITFHRVIPGFMAQTGDPTGTGTGGPGYIIPDEVKAEMKFDRPGLLAMANAGPNTTGSQFFITYAPAPWLEGHFTIFGEVIKGMDALEQLTPRDPDKNPTTPGDKLISVTISETENSQRPTPTPTATPFAPNAANTNHALANMDLKDRIEHWNTPPENILKKGKIYVANIETEEGTIQVELLANIAPKNVNNFVVLANNGYYDGTRFFQVIADTESPDGGLIVALGGDPAGTGNGTPGYVIEDELQENAFNDRGWLGSAQPDSNRNGGSFFITLKPSPWLSAHFTPLGRVIGGQEVLDKFTPLEPNNGVEPQGMIIKRISISTAKKSLLPTPTPMPTPAAPIMPEGDARPLSKVAPAERNDRYNTPPEMQIDPDKDYQAIIRTDKGDITLDLFEKQTPITVNNFVVLARLGYYDNTTFHRVIADFMAQGGDPSGTGAGSPGYTFEDEIVNELRFDGEGLLAMANRGYNTNGAQFFITLAETPWLNDKHTIFGKVIAGMDVVKTLNERDPQTATEPGDKIIRIDIIEK